MTRGSQSVHISADGREWLFERNTVDPRRVSATLIDHAARAIVLYGESDLRMMLGIRGWVDVVSLGFDSHLLDQYKKTSNLRRVGALRFVRYESVDPQRAGRDLWWNEEHALASGFTIDDESGTTRFAIEHASAIADTSILRPPVLRFPGYRVVGLADWLERH